jgi:hypothetical protein
LSRIQSAYLKAINERGGINGRKITLLFRDDGYSPPKSREVIRQLVEDDHSPLFFFAVALGAAGLNPGFQSSYLHTKSPDLLNYVVPLLTGLKLASER